MNMDTDPFKKTLCKLDLRRKAKTKVNKNA